ncbi:MAG: hypothetical protein R3F54_04740 [Alphaproteobacteria bacterium]
MIWSLLLLLVVTVAATWWSRRLAAARGRSVAAWSLATALFPPIVLMLRALPARPLATGSA